MAKKNKKPRHTRIVVPGMSTRGGKAKARDKKSAQAAPREPAAAQEEPQAAPDLPPVEEVTTEAAALPANAVALPRARAENPRIQAMRRKRRRHRIQGISLVLAFVLLVLLYFSEGYLVALAKGSEWLEGARIALQGGEGFPMEFEMPGFKEAESIGSTAFAVLGEKDMAIVSKDGREVYRIQHGYGNPHITAGNARVAVYNRGGTGFSVEGRDRRLYTGEMDQSILFCEMGPGGNLAVVTYARYRYTLRVYDTLMSEEPLITVPYVDESPYMLSFLSDNKHFALATLSTEGGARRTTIQFMHTGKADIVASVDAGNAVALRMEYLSQSRLLVIYDTYAAVYDAKAREVARYDYEGAALYTADTSGTYTALVFGTLSHNQLRTVVLDSSLAPVQTLHSEASEVPRILISGRTLYLLAGYNVHTYSITGESEALNAYELDSVGYGFVGLGAPLLLRSGAVESVGWMNSAGAQPPGGEASTSVPASGTQASPGTSLPEESDTGGVSEGGGEPPDDTQPTE